MKTTLQKVILMATFSAIIGWSNIASAQPGSLDNTFGTSGKVMTGITTSDFGRAMAIQSDGKIIVGGTTIPPNLIYAVALVRYKTNGFVDNTFGNAGRVITTLGGDGCSGNSIAIQSDGKIILAGDWEFASSHYFVLVRYKTNGNLDSTFGNNGIVETYMSGSTAKGMSVVIQSDGKIILAGATNGGFTLVRYNNDGSKDTTFGSSGKVVT